MNEDGELRTLAELRIRVSGRFERWLREFGATPASRIAWVDKLSSPDDLVAKLRQAMAQPDVEHGGGAEVGGHVIDAGRHRAAGLGDRVEDDRGDDRADADRHDGRAADGGIGDGERDGLDDDRDVV